MVPNHTTETFRLRKSIKFQGMALAALFLAVSAACSSVFFLEDPAKHGFKGEHSVAIVGGLGIALFGSMLLMSIYIWAAYYVERFVIDGAMIWVRSMFQNCRFDVSELQRLKWRTRPAGGSIVFQVPGSRARLDLYGFSEDHRLKIVEHLHDVVPPTVQEGWPLFRHRIALPLRDPKASLLRTWLPSNIVTVTRRRYDRMMVFAFPLSIAVGVALWVWLETWPLLLSPPLLVIGAWILLRFHVPPGGMDQLRLDKSSQGRSALVGWGILLFSMLLIPVLPLFGFSKDMACWAACGVLLIVMTPIGYCIHRADKGRRAVEARAIGLAPIDWLQAQHK